MKFKPMIASVTVVISMLAGSTLSVASDVDAKRIERGRYLVITSGCNDCHTPGYAESGGKTPESQWLTGSPVGFQGPWGTSYPANLRIILSDMSEKQWLKRAHSPMRPPMPWFNLSQMTDKDLRAIYHFVRSLKRAGKPAPAYVPPGQAANTPYIEFVPKNLPVTAQAGK